MRRARRQRGERRGREPCGLAQPAGLRLRERTRPDPAEQRPVRLPPDDVFMYRPARECREPASAGIASGIRRARAAESRRRIRPPRSLRRSPPATARCGGQSAGAAQRALAHRRRAAGHPRSGAPRVRPGTGRRPANRWPHRPAMLSVELSCMARSCGSDASLSSSALGKSSRGLSSFAARHRHANDQRGFR